MSSAYTGSKWGAPGYGNSGGQVSWSFASFAGLLVEFDDAITALPFQNSVRAAFQAWESVADIDFVEVADSLASDIRLGWEHIDGAGGTLGYAHWQYGGQTTSYSEIAFDAREAWTAPGVSSGGGHDFLAVAIHEIGHSIGLSHAEDPDSIMHAYLGPQAGLSQDDVAAIQILYGAARPAAQTPPPEPPARPADPVIISDDAGEGTVSVFRFYNSQTGVHFYTGSEAERDVIVSTLGHMHFEGEAFDAPANDGIAIYRFFNASSGAHFYTSSRSERDVVVETMDSFRYEGVTFFAHASDGAGEHEALHRFFNTDTGAHFYTASEDERAQVEDDLPQFRYEGVAYYVDVI